MSKLVEVQLYNPNLKYRWFCLVTNIKNRTKYGYSLGRAIGRGLTGIVYTPIVSQKMILDNPGLTITMDNDYSND